MGGEDAVLGVDVGVDGDELAALRNIKRGKAKQSKTAQRPFSCQRKKSLCAEDSLHLYWLTPLGRRPCRESGPPQSLQLGPAPTPVHGMRPHGKPVSEMARDRMVVETCDCNGLWPLVVESLWLQSPVAVGCRKPVAAPGATYQLCAAHPGQGIRCC